MTTIVEATNSPEVTNTTDDAHLPRAGRRFPFRAINEGEEKEVNDAIGRELLGIEKMIRKAVRKRFPDVGDSDRDDISQDVAIQIWRRSLPNFDQTRDTKVSTYLQRCIDLYLGEIQRRRGRQKYSPMAVLHDEHAARDTSADRAVEQLATDVLANPEQYFDHHAAATVLHAQNTPNHVAGQVAGVQAQQVSHIRKQLREKVRAMADDLPG